MNFKADTAQKIRNGDEQAFEEVFRGLYPKLCVFANRFLADHDHSEEVVQEVFFTFWAKRESLEIKGEIGAYLYRSVRNACINQLNHQKVKQAYISDQLKESIENHQLEADPMVQSELQRKIPECMSKLPTERQRIFRLSREDGLKYREIAEKLGISIKTVEAQMGKALANLKECLKEYLILLFLFFLKFFDFF